MSDEAAFKATILERPDEDGPRLVFADWLDEQGDCERAEFIRVEIELARLEGESERRAVLVERDRELLERHRREWLAPLLQQLEARRHRLPPPRLPVPVLQVMQQFFGAGVFRRLDDPLAGRQDVNELLATMANVLIDPIQFQMPIESRFGCEFRRGFVERVQLLASDFAHHAEVLLNEVPLREIAVTDGHLASGMIDLFRSPALARLSGLELQGTLDETAVRCLLSCPYLEKLSRLSLAGATVLGVTPAILGEVGNVPNLRELRLAGIPLGDAGAAELARNSIWSRLEALDLRRTGLGDAGVSRLAHSPHLPRLRQLNLSQNLITRTGVAELAESPQLGRLSHLNISHNRLADNERQSLNRFIARLMGNRSLPPWLQHLLDSPLTSRLDTLVLDRDAVDPADRNQLQKQLGERLHWADA